MRSNAAPERSFRWRIAALLTVAIAISYLDRQTLAVAVAAIQEDIPISNTPYSTLNTAFLLAYAVMYAGGGKVIDLLGTRRGSFAIMIAWSLACASQGLATSFAALAAGCRPPPSPRRNPSIQRSVASPPRWPTEADTLKKKALQRPLGICCPRLHAYSPAS